MKQLIFMGLYFCVCTKNVAGQITSKAQLPTPLQNGLVAYYPFAGNTNDVSGFGNTIQNYGAILVEDQAGHPSSAYRFDGVSSYMTIPYATSFEALTDQFSISYWIKNNKPVNHGGMHLLHRQDGNLSISIGGNNEIDFTRQGQAYLLQSNQILDTNWFNMVFTKNGPSHKLYINGILVQSSTTNIGLNNTSGNELTIGKATAGGNGGAYRLEADLAQLMWYNRLLTDSEILSLYNMNTDSTDTSRLISSSDSVICKGDSVRLSLNLNKGDYQFVGSFRESDYFLDKRNRTWYGAKEYAETKGTRLWVINSQEENDSVYNNLLPYKNNNMVNYWIGLYQDHNDPNYSEPAGGWKWVDGTPLTYTNWLSGEPNNQSGFYPYWEDFVMMWTVPHHGKWNDYYYELSDPAIIGKFNVYGVAESPKRKFRWSTGDTTTAITVYPTQSTKYYVAITEGDSTIQDSVIVSVQGTTLFNPFSDTIITSKKSLNLDAGSGFSSYSWNTGSSDQQITIDSSGMYKVDVSDGSVCALSDSVLVHFFNHYVVSNDTIICKDASLELNVMERVSSNVTEINYDFSSCSNDVFYPHEGAVISIIQDGRSGCALSLQGNAASTIKNDFGYGTFEVFAKAGSSVANQYFGILDGQLFMDSRPSGTDDVGFGLYYGGVRVMNSYSNPASYGDWYSLKIRYTEDSMKFWINNTLVYESLVPFQLTTKTGSIIVSAYDRSLYDDFSAIPLPKTFNESVIWSTGDTTNSISVHPENSTRYYVTISDGQFTCTDSIQINLSDLSSFNPFADTLITNSLPYTINVGSGYASYSWNTGDSLSSITTTSPGTYSVIVSSELGCTVTDTVRIFLRPLVLSLVRQQPTDSLTNSSSLNYRIRFSKAISGLNAIDFDLFVSGSASASVGTITSINDSTYDVAVTNILGTGSLRLDLKASGTDIADADGIGMDGGYSSGQYYWIDQDAPETSIASNPSARSKSSNANFLFRSNESDIRYELSTNGSDYVLLTDSTKSFTGLTAGNYRIDVRAVDAAGNKDASPASWIWTVDLTAPSLLSSNRQVPVDSVTNATTLTWRVRFSEPVLGVDTSDFTLTAVTPAVGKLSGITKVTDSIYDVSATVSNNTGGSLRLDLKSSGTGITDSASNDISGGFTTGQKYALSNVSIKCPSNITVAAATGKCTQTVAFTGVNAVTVTGVTNPTIAYSPASGTAFAVGTTNVTATVKSGTTTVGTCTFTVTVTDSQLPTVSALSLSSGMLAPADHTMKTINLTYTATDNCTPVTSVVTVTSNEPDAGTGVGDLPGDIVIVSAKQIQLRAEKTPGSASRVYTITLTVTDKGGNKVVKTVEVRVVHEILSPGTGSCYAINSTVPFNGQYWDASGLTHTASWTADATIITGTDLEPSGANNGTVNGSYKFTTSGVYKLKMNLKDNKNVTTYSDLNRGLGSLVTIFGNTGTYSYGGGCMEIPAGSLVSKPTTSGKASFGYTVSGTSATTGKGEVELDFRTGAWEFNTTTITNYTVSGAKLTMSGTGKVTGVTTTYNYTLTAIDGNHPLGGGTDKVRLRVTTTAGAVIFDNNPGALATADPNTAVCTGLGQVYVPGGAAVGTLETPREAINLTQEKQPLSIKVSPNPSLYSFKIAFVSGTKEPVKMRLTDLFGRLVDERSEIRPNSVIEIGQKLRSGVYMAEFYQGEERVVVKMVKAE